MTAPANITEDAQTKGIKAFNLYERGILIDRVPASEGCMTADYAVRHWSRMNGHHSTDHVHAEPAQ